MLLTSIISAYFLIGIAITSAVRFFVDKRPTKLKYIAICVVLWPVLLVLLFTEMKIWNKEI